MFRRSLVWKAKARFIHKKFLAKYPDHELDGIFEADPSLNKFLTSSQASVAGLRLQWAFECDHNKEDCYQIIEDYCNGGDNYLTEDVMRSACGLPVRQRNLQTEEGLANLLNADADSALVKHMLDKELEGISFYEFKKIPVQADVHPNLTKSDMWDALEAESVVRKCISKGKTTKDRPGTCFPMLEFGTDFGSIRPLPAADATDLELDEEHDAGLIRRYAYRCRGRSMNEENLSVFYSSMLPSVQKKGRRTNDVAEAVNRYQTLVHKIKDHGDRLSALLASKRRLTEKKSVERSVHADSGTGEAASEVKWPSSRVATKVRYQHSTKHEYSVPSRRYSGTEGAQSMSRRLQKHAVDSHTLDLDIHNCAFQILRQIIQKTQPKPALPKDLDDMLEEVTMNRSAFLARLDVDVAEGKNVIHAVLNGGVPPDNLKKNEAIVALQKISLYARWVAMNLLYEDYMSLKENKDKTFPSASILSLMWQSVEDMILQVWAEYAITLKPKHVSLHFDGIRLSKDVVDNVDSHIEQCQKIIMEKTGFAVKILRKTHCTFRELVAERGTPCAAARNIPPQLLTVGNCIPCSLWHCFQTARAAIAAYIQDPTQSHNAEAKKLGYRSYRSTSIANGIELAGCVGLPPDSVKSFLLHYEGNGHPHCICVKHDVTGGCTTILDGASGFRMTVRQLKEIVSSSVDEATIISYWKPTDEARPEGKNAVLLDMVAGASDEESDCSAKSNEATSLGRQCDDQDSPLVIDDGILGMLEEETKSMREEARQPKRPVNGRHQCPGCPFRSFKERRRLRTHLDKYHVAKNQYVTSGTKQLKIILALYDHAASSQQAPTNLLRKSASLIRETVKPPLPASNNLIDKQIRLLYDSDGPRYVNLSQLDEELHVRRVRNRYYTKAFGDLILKEAVHCYAQARSCNTGVHDNIKCRLSSPTNVMQVRTMETRLHIAAIAAGSTVSTLNPTGARHWLPILEDVAYSPAMEQKINDMNAYLEDGDEWHYVSIDATMKVCLKLKGQAPHRMSKDVRDAAPFGDDFAWRRLLTVRGRTGAVLLLYPLQDESAARIVEAFSLNFTQSQLAAIVHVASDSPSEKLYSELGVICPSLKSLMLDPVHLAIVYEYGFWNKRSTGSKVLRRIVSKCSAVAVHGGPSHLGSYYDGALSRPLTAAETDTRNMILEMSMQEHEAKDVLDNLDLDEPFLCRIDFIRCIAALCSRHATEVRRKAPGPNKEIYKILWSACAPDRLEWLMNNIRSRRTMSTPYLQMLPTGTSGNESLHAEINSWSRSTNALHRSTLALRLRYYHYIKLLMHHLATKHPMSHIVTAQMLLGRSLHQSIWTDEEWAAWCIEQKQAGSIQKAALPLTAARSQEAAVVREWCAKRPASKKRTGAGKSKHTTPLTVKRRHTVRSSGVKVH